jgi:hypothetical protein
VWLSILGKKQESDIPYQTRNENGFCNNFAKKYTYKIILGEFDSL